jgi:hypothetical protein
MNRKRGVISAIITFAQFCMLGAFIALSHGGAGAGAATGSIAITGTVTNQSGTGVANVSVYATDPGGSTVDFGPTTTASDGSYVLDVNAGSYDFHFDPTSGSGMNSVVDSNVTVLSNQTINIQLVPTPVTYTVSGHVTDGSNQPIANAYVYIDSANEGALTDSTGYYSIQVSPGTYTGATVSMCSGEYAHCNPSSPDTANGAARPDEFDLDDSSLTINASSGNVSQDFHLNTAQVTIQVKDSSGNLAPGVAGLEAQTGGGSTALIPNGSEQFTGYTNYNASYNTTLNQTGEVVLNVPVGLTFGTGTDNSTLASYLCISFAAGPTCLSQALTVTGNVTLIFQEGNPVVETPTAPSLSAPSPTNQSPSLTWNSVSGATSYNVYYGNGTFITNVIVSSYTDKSAAPGSSNTYYVTAVNSAGESAHSNTVSVLYDTALPTITYTVSSAPNVAGWYNGPVTITFTCSDPTTGVTVASCSAPVTLSNDGANQTVTGSAVDSAGNSATVTTSPINIDQTPPTISYSVSPAPNSNDWNNSSVTVSFTCSDSTSGIASCPQPITISSTGANQTATGTAYDVAGNSSSVTAKVNIDETAPVVGAPTWSANPLTAGQNTTVTIPASDNLSGVVSGEYYIGTTDPGQGNGTAISYAAGNLTVAFGSNLTPGIYQINFRAEDAAGNWSGVTTDYLVVYNPTSGSAAGHISIVPVYGSDNLPGLTSSTQKDKVSAPFSVKYTNGVIDQSSSLQLSYSTGSNCNKPTASNCHSTNFTSTSIDWMVIGGTNNSVATIQGSGTLTIDGTTTTNPFRVIATDGSQLTPKTNDNYEIEIFAPGADPNTATPLYYLNDPADAGSVTGNIRVNS